MLKEIGIAKEKSQWIVHLVSKFWKPITFYMLFKSVFKWLRNLNGVKNDLSSVWSGVQNKCNYTICENLLSEKASHKQVQIFISYNWFYVPLGLNY